VLRLLPLLLLASCGSRASNTFEETVSDALYEFEQCRTGHYPPREDFPYSETGAMSVCRACWLGERPPLVYCTAQLDRDCDAVLASDRCACEWQTSFVDEQDCRACLVDACGVEAITDDAAVCAQDNCDRPGACEFSAVCTIQ
jgi:hypothetical protein